MMDHVDIPELEGNPRRVIKNFQTKPGMMDHVGPPEPE
jgi:hypothetical protein